MNDEFYIRKTFALAGLALGNTWPNPMVGAVIVKNGEIIGHGFHHKSGQDHAEIDALKSCQESPEGATLYVNLEPCCHNHKQTPPCAQRLIKEKIRKVVISNLDPNPAVNGSGIQLLREAGIEVVHGILAHEGEELNEVFFHAQRAKKPFVHLKLASTLDGKIAHANGESKWITGVEARSMVHQLRGLHQAVIVGAETVRRDNPKLNVRTSEFKGEQPYRVVFTESGKLPPTADLFKDELKERTIIYSKAPLSFDFDPKLTVQINTLEDALTDLYNRKIINVFLEGGAKLAASFLAARAVNRVSYFINPSFIGNGPSAIGDFGLDGLHDRPTLTKTSFSQVGSDFYITGRIY